MLIMVDMCWEFAMDSRFYVSPNYFRALYFITIIKNLHVKIYDNKKLSYKALKCSSTGWINASVFLPLEFDLCTLKTQKSKCTGWHTGGIWVGLKLKKNDKVIAWKPDNNTCNKKTHKKTDNS